MKQVIILRKKEGETPLEALGRFRAAHPAYKNAKMTYAGRLDPMAEGLLLVLAGNEIRNKDAYLALDKEYEFDVLFGFATDTHDILGLIEHSHVPQDIGMPELERKIQKALPGFRGKIVQKYPLYSSKTVRGKPLFAYGRAGASIETPERNVTVKKLKLVRLRRINGRRLLSEIRRRIGKVKGDFRQAEALRFWRKHLRGREADRLYLGSFHIRCSSGTYVRGLADSLGRSAGIPALAWKIKRTKIGKFDKIT